MAHSDQSLQDILRTLSSFTSPQQSAPGTDLPALYSKHPVAEEASEDYDPTSFDPSNFNITNRASVSSQPPAGLPAHNFAFHLQPHALPEPQTQPQSYTQPPPLQSSSTPNPSDPRNIHTWSAAMTHMRPLLADESFVARVRKLIKNQHLNERQWWEGRQALIKQQGERGQKKSELAGVLKALGGKVSEGSAPVSSTEDEAAELARYDAKIYRVMGRMVAGTMQDLAAMGIPFFGAREALLGEGGAEEAGVEGIGRGELRALQKRMLDYLETTCQE